MSILVVTAVAAEADAVVAGLPTSVGLTVAAVGVGPVAAAAGTARRLALAEAAGRPHTAVVNAGIAGGFVGRAAVGATVIGASSVAADLGAESEEGFLSLDDLGFGTPTVVTADPALLAALRGGLPDAVVGEILTVTTVTGTDASTAALLARRPEAVAEAMEGFGAAHAAAEAGLPFVELRTISNPIGPRHRDGWQIGAALSALTAAAPAVGALTAAR
ncbi:futalosine hydrolase [Pilimelia columellifera]|uniref:Futalosine hydrolase n=1 Tax=Pilimelia columellifera subsp. columellifera TaxID=706583 RepID=A0ABN3MWZ3_9ACTN